MVKNYLKMSITCKWLWNSYLTWKWSFNDNQLNVTWLGNEVVNLICQQGRQLVSLGLTNKPKGRLE